MIRVLQVFSTLNAGGMENYIMNLYRKMDRDEIQFDFLVHHRKRGLFEDEIEAMGGKIYHFSVLDDKNILKYQMELDHFFKQHPEYKIVHGHLSSLAVFYLGAAKKNGVPWRIVHSHGAGFLRTPKGYAKYLLFRFAKWNANMRLACSTEAGVYLYGKKSFRVVPNGIDSHRFAFDPQIRQQMRQELGVAENFVIGHVGRFNLQKNHVFLLRMFRSLLQEMPDARLLLLGDGELREAVQQQAVELGISHAVIFAGVHKDCERYYQAMDVFVLPSLFEGLPVTGVEAQYAGLPCLFSDAITREVSITSKVSFLNIGEENITQWCDQLKRIASEAHRTSADITSDLFDADEAVKQMAKLYQDLWEREPC